MTVSTLERSPPGEFLRERSLLDRLPGLCDADAPELVGSKLLSFYRIFTALVCSELWSELAGVQGHAPILRAAVAILFTGCMVALWARRFTKIATLAAVSLLVLRLACFFPYSANHYYVEVVTMLFLALLGGERAEEKGALLRALCWTVIVALFMAGIQKVLHGYYFRGEFLAFMVATDPRFGILGHFMPEQDFLRLRSLSQEIGAGPFRVDSLLFIACSNLSYLLEIGLPVALLFRRTRSAGMIGSIAFIAWIEVFARELFFGALMVNFLLLFSRTDLNRKLLPCFVLLGLYLLAVKTGLLPGWSFT